MGPGDALGCLQAIAGLSSPSFGAQHHLSSLTPHRSLSTPGQGLFITLCSAPCPLSLRIISSLSFPGPLTPHDVFSDPSYGGFTQAVTFCHCTLSSLIIYPVQPACSCLPRGPKQSIHGMGQSFDGLGSVPLPTLISPGALQKPVPRDDAQ